MRLDREGYALVLILAGAAAGSSAPYMHSGHIAFLVTGAIFAASALFSAYFFRDPVRRIPDDSDVVVSAADGVVVDVSRVEADGFESPALRIAVFMNVFNVHVNRTPLAGVVSSVRHRDGKKFSAYNKRAEYENEHGDTDIQTARGLVRVRQIAGLVARRVVTRVTEGMSLECGERIGIIRFGSRVDVFLPEGFSGAVVCGERVRAGETIIARFEPNAVSTESR